MKRRYRWRWRSGPVVVFPDEPTSGLDPKSRRDAAAGAAAEGDDAVLTTHFLEEADLLCDRSPLSPTETSVRGFARVPQERVGRRVFAHDDVRRVAREVG